MHIMNSMHMHGLEHLPKFVNAKKTAWDTVLYNTMCLTWTLIYSLKTNLRQYQPNFKTSF